MPLASKLQLTLMGKYLRVQLSAVLSDKQSMLQLRLHLVCLQRKAPQKPWPQEYWYTLNLDLFFLFLSFNLLHACH